MSCFVKACIYENVVWDVMKGNVKVYYFAACPSAEVLDLKMETSGVSMALGVSTVLCPRTVRLQMVKFPYYKTLGYPYQAKLQP